MQEKASNIKSCVSVPFSMLVPQFQCYSQVLMLVPQFTFIPEFKCQSNSFDSPKFSQQSQIINVHINPMVFMLVPQFSSKSQGFHDSPMVFMLDTRFSCQYHRPCSTCIFTRMILRVSANEILVINITAVHIDDYKT